MKKSRECILRDNSITVDRLKEQKSMPSDEEIEKGFERCWEAACNYYANRDGSYNYKSFLLLEKATRDNYQPKEIDWDKLDVSFFKWIGKNNNYDYPQRVFNWFKSKLNR